MSTTRSGSSSARLATQRCLDRWPGVMCRSLRCRTLMSRVPGGSTGAWPRATSSVDARCRPRTRTSPRRRRRLRWRPVPSCSPLQGTCGLASPVREPASSRSTNDSEKDVLSTLKVRLRDDLTAAMKARDGLVEVDAAHDADGGSATWGHGHTKPGTRRHRGPARSSPRTQGARRVGGGVRRRGPRRAGSAGAGGGRIPARYLPQQLGDEELAVLARDAVAAVEAETGQAPGPRQMGQVMKKARRPRQGGGREAGVGGGEGAVGGAAVVLGPVVLGAGTFSVTPPGAPSHCLTGWRTC